MKRTAQYALLGAALILGVVAGAAGTAIVASPEPGQVHNHSLSVGDRAPDFRLPDHTGGYVQLGEFLGKSNVVIAFYPLAWTPV